MIFFIELPLDIERTLNVRKTYRRGCGRLMYVQFIPRVQREIVFVSRLGKISDLKTC